MRVKIDRDTISAEGEIPPPLPSRRRRDLLRAFSFLLLGEPTRRIALGQGGKPEQGASLSAPTQSRRSLRRVFDKLLAGGPVTIAFLGESLSAGEGASRAEQTSMRALVTTWFRKTFPKARLDAINAAISGTDSLYGTLRLRRDLLTYKPDLVIIEFLRQDARREEKAVQKSLEGILRQLLLLPQPPEALLIYPTSPQGLLPVEWHERIASHYRIPSLNLEPEVTRAIRAGEMLATQFWSPPLSEESPLTDIGHRFSAERIIERLKAEMEEPSSPLMRSLPFPLVSDELNYGEFRPLAELRSPFRPQVSWQLEATQDRHFPTHLLVTDRQGAEISTYFEGTAIGLTFLKGPDGGTFEVLIDGKPAPAPLTRIETYHPTRRLGTALLPGGLSLGEHTLTVRLLPERHPQSTGQKIRLGYLLVGGQRPERL
jgi:hypothetical protein